MIRSEIKDEREGRNASVRSGQPARARAVTACEEGTGDAGVDVVWQWQRGKAEPRSRKMPIAFAFLPRLPARRVVRGDFDPPNSTRAWASSPRRTKKKRECLPRHCQRSSCRPWKPKEDPPAVTRPSEHAAKAGETVPLRPGRPPRLVSHARD